MKKPDEILELFQKNWSGSEDEFEEALNCFLDDLMDSIRLAGGEETLIEEVETYVGSHYF